MAKALTAARAELGEHAPRIEMFKIPTDKIREVIGTGGKVIREIVEKTGAKINIEDDGTVKVASADGESIKAAIKWIKSIASDPEPGTIYDGTVVKVMDFGAFVNFFGAKDGLVHISQLAPHRVNKVTDVVKEGDKVKVKLLGMDERGKVRLSMKAVDQTTGEDLEAKQKARRARSRRPAARPSKTQQSRNKGRPRGRPFYLQRLDDDARPSASKSSLRGEVRRQAKPTVRAGSGAVKRNSLTRSSRPPSRRDLRQQRHAIAVRHHLHHGGERGGAEARAASRRDARVSAPRKKPAPGRAGNGPPPTE